MSLNPLLTDIMMVYFAKEGTFYGVLDSKF